MAVCATVTLVSLQGQIQEVQAANAKKEKQISTAEQNNEKLKAQTEDMKDYKAQYDAAAVSETDTGSSDVLTGVDNDAMDEAARARGYVEPDEIIFEDTNN
jgi:cell division protein FtsB